MDWDFPHPDFGSRILDLGVKKTPDPGSGSVTLKDASDPDAAFDRKKTSYKGRVFPPTKQADTPYCKSGALFIVFVKTNLR